MRPILSDYVIPAKYRPHAAKEKPADAVELTWLGVTGFSIKYRETTLLIDPYVSRATLVSLAFRRLRADIGAIRRHVPKADFICVGHTHYDHVADVPAIVKRDNAVVFGSRSTSNLLARSEIRRNRFTTVPRKGGIYRAGDMQVSMVEGRHGPIFFGRVPYPGPISSDITPPLRTMQYRVGDVFGVHVRAGNVSIYHNGTANLLDESLQRLEADILLAGLSGAEHTENYIARLCGPLKTKTIIPTHYDAFFGPIEDGLQVLPIVDLDKFFSDSEEAGAAVCMPQLVETLWISQDGQVMKSATAD